MRKGEGFPHFLLGRNTSENYTWNLTLTWEPQGFLILSLHLRHLWQISQASLPDFIPPPHALLNAFCMTDFPMGNYKDPPDSIEKFINQLDLIQVF